MHTLASLEFLQSFANNDPNAVAIMQELFYRQEDLLDQLDQIYMHGGKCLEQMDGGFF